MDALGSTFLTRITNCFFTLRRSSCCSERQQHQVVLSLEEVGISSAETQKEKTKTISPIIRLETLYDELIEINNIVCSYPAIKKVKTLSTFSKRGLLLLLLRLLPLFLFFFRVQRKLLVTRSPTTSTEALSFLIETPPLLLVRLQR